MKFARTFFSMGAAALAACIVFPAQAGSVPVGSSTLINVLDYSDTFTTTDAGGVDDRDGVGMFPMSWVDYPVNGVPGEGLAVENCYGNPQRYWNDNHWSIVTDATATSGANSTYPGTSGGGSDTGFTEGQTSYDGWSVQYGNLRSRFVVQVDAVQPEAWVGLMFGPTPDFFWDDGVFTLYFRPPGSGYFDIQLLEPWDDGDTGLTTPVTGIDEWHNYAADIDLTARKIKVYVDEVWLGDVEIDAVGGGIHAGKTLDATYVGVFLHDEAGDRLWSDNFQIGAPFTASIPGDTNNDQKVNEADANKLAENWGANVGDGGFGAGDFNSDGLVNAADASILAANWGDHTGGAGERTSVPEPGAIALLVGIGLALAARRLRR